MHDNFKNYFLLFDPKDDQYRKLVNVLGEISHYFTIGAGTEHPLADCLTPFLRGEPGSRSSKDSYRVCSESLAVLKSRARCLADWTTAETKEGITFWRADGTYVLTQLSPKGVIPMVLSDEDYSAVTDILPSGALYLSEDNEDADEADELLMKAAATFHQKLLAKNN